MRVNNAIFRSGHLHNSLSIDPLFLERTEVMFGPSSVGYGSDAIGGVIHFYSKEPLTNEIRKQISLSLLQKILVKIFQKTPFFLSILIKNLLYCKVFLFRDLGT